MPSEESSLETNQDSTSSSNSVPLYRPVVEERRQASRFRRERGSDFAVIWQDSGGQLLVEVDDESLFGLGIFVDTTLGLVVGSKLHVIYSNEYMEGEVRQIRQVEEGFRIGLRCRRILNDAASD